MKKIKLHWKILIGLFVLMQFFQIDKTNPPVNTDSDFIQIEKPSPAIAKLIKDACYDCHSNETQYPWYTNIQPVGWWIRGHYRGARGDLNYSEWAEYNDEDKPSGLKEMAEEVEEMHMPLKSYTWMHPKSKMNEEQRKELVSFFLGLSKK